MTRSLFRKPAVSASAAKPFSLALLAMAYSFLVPAGTLAAQVLGGGLGSVKVSLPAVTVSTSSLPQNSATLFINGTGFNATPANNTVAFNLGAAGTVTSCSGTTQLTVTFSTAPGVGDLTATVTVSSVGSSPTVQVATIVPAVTPNTANLAVNAATIVIAGAGFDPTAANNTVVFNSGAGTVTSATTTQLTVTFTTAPSLGSLTAVVTTDSLNSGTAVQVATTICSPTSITITAPPIWVPGSATVTVAVAADSGGPPTGNVTLSVDGGDDLTLALTDGSATFDVGGLRPGRRVLYAAYAAQGLFLASSKTGTQIVHRLAGEPIRAAGDKNPSDVRLSFTAKVTVTSGTKVYTDYEIEDRRLVKAEGMVGGWLPKRDPWNGRDTIVAPVKTRHKIANSDTTGITFPFDFKLVLADEKGKMQIVAAKVTAADSDRYWDGYYGVDPKKAGPFKGTYKRLAGSSFEMNCYGYAFAKNYNVNGFEVVFEDEYNKKPFPTFCAVGSAADKTWCVVHFSPKVKDHCIKIEQCCEKTYAVGDQKFDLPKKITERNQSSGLYEGTWTCEPGGTGMPIIMDGGVYCKKKL